MDVDDITVGTCGYGFYTPPDGWQDHHDSKLAAFAAEFEAVELNKTFYSLPQRSTAERWRREAGDAFVFTVKAWQAITHPRSSPTWNDYRDEIPETDGDIGYFRPTESVVTAWEATKAVATALDADVCVFQTPPSFDNAAAHRENIRAFISEIDREGLRLAWEPRGDWHEHPDVLAELCAELDLIHVVDILREWPRDPTPFGYVRLHGLSDDRYDYDYDYSEEELHEVAHRLDAALADREVLYCMFNNYNMYEDASQLREILRRT